MKTRSVFRNYWYILKNAFHFSKIGVAVSMILRVMEFFLESFSALWVLYKVIGIIENGGRFADILPWILGAMIGYLVYYAMLNFYDSCMKAGCDAQIRGGFENMLFDKVSQMDLICFDDPTYYAGYSRALYCVGKVITPVLTTIFSMAAFVVMLVNTTVLLCKIEAWLLVAGLFAIGTYKLGKQYGKLRADRQMEKLEYGRRQDYVRRISLDRNYAQELRTSRIMDVLDQMHQKAAEGKQRVNRDYGRRLAVLSFWNTICSVDGVEIFCYGYAALRILIFHNMDVAEMAVLFAAVIQYSSRLRRMVTFLADMREKSGYVDAFRDMVETKPKMDKKNPSGEKFESLEFQNVSFQYGDSTILHDVNFRIGRGETVMIAGANGAGKSTLAKLMMGLYDPCQGEVVFNGKNVSRLEQQEYRSHFSYMPQDVQVYDMSVGENILMREPAEQDMQMIRQAAAFARMDRWLGKQGKDLDSQVGRSFDGEGMELSGGQKQSLVLARLYAHPSEFYILDEPSSALDPIAEAELFQRLLQISNGKTTVFISHRLISAKYADRILFLDHGRILETGSHEELMKKGGQYAEMYAAQASYYQDHPAAGTSGQEAVI